MEHTLNSLAVVSSGYPRISSDVSAISFQSQVFTSMVKGKKMFTIEYRQDEAGQQGSRAYHVHSLVVTVMC